MVRAVPGSMTVSAATTVRARASGTASVDARGSAAGVATSDEAQRSVWVEVKEAPNDEYVDMGEEEDWTRENPAYRDEEDDKDGGNGTGGMDAEENEGGGNGTANAKSKKELAKEEKPVYVVHTKKGPTIRRHDTLASELIPHEEIASPTTEETFDKSAASAVSEVRTRIACCSRNSASRRSSDILMHPAAPTRDARTCPIGTRSSSPT